VGCLGIGKLGFSLVIIFITSEMSGRSYPQKLNMFLSLWHLSVQKLFPHATIYMPEHKNGLSGNFFSFKPKGFYVFILIKLMSYFSFDLKFFFAKFKEKLIEKQST
jgi:hypothetical protein